MSDLPAKCAVCLSLLDEEDLFCGNCGTEAPPREAGVAAGANGMSASPGARPRGPSSRLARDNFTCTGCGASMSYDAGAKALRCPFCGSTQMQAQPDLKVLTPSRVVPFRLRHDEAAGAMRLWLGRGWFRPSGLSERAMIVEMVPVYVPYWVFQADTHTYWTADSSHTPPGARANWYPLAGEHRGSYAELLIGASGALSPQETWDLGPFDLGTAVPPEEVDLENITVEQFSVPRKYARPLARQGLEQREAQTCAEAYVPGEARNVHVNVRITSLASEPVLLPVWIMAYRFRDRVYRFLVNGQSGRVTGQAPVSYLKIAGAALALVGLALLGLLLGSAIAGR